MTCSTAAITATVLFAALPALACAPDVCDETLWIPPTNCYVVRNTPDGFLAVRQKPTPKSKMLAALRPNFPLEAYASSQFLENDEYRLFPNWTHWTRVKGWFDTQSGDQPSTGWVYNKYIKTIPCKFAE
jgi:hypothetical protein